ncbi:MAG: protein jag [Deltaproteobacteria bacterium]|nr:MAG: protein jag [Deltaproteobacteria bacterium]
MRIVEKEGKTREEAIEAACKELDCSEEQLEVEVISKGSGLLRFVGGEKVKIRAALKEEVTATEGQGSPPDSAPQEASIKTEGEEGQAIIGNKVKEFLEGVISRIGMEASVIVEETSEEILLTIKGDGSGLLIGKRGQTLDALQYLANKVAIRLTSGRWEEKRVIVDTEHYRERREESLRILAFRMAEKARNQGKPVMLESMNPRERRIIHLALSELEGVKTQSEGEDSERRLVIYPI